MALDIVHVHFTQETPAEPLHMKLLHYGEVDFPAQWEQKTIRVIKDNENSPGEISVLNIRLGEFVEDAPEQFPRGEGCGLETDVDIIGGQGQTLWHLPLPDPFPGRDVSRAHEDISEISIIAARTGITTMGDLRPTKNRAVQNIGSIANFVISPAGVDQKIADQMLAGPYFQHKIPKTTGSETTGDGLAEDICRKTTQNGASLEDCVAIITCVTAQSLLNHYRRRAPECFGEVFLRDGGSYNPNIIDYLRENMPNTQFATIDGLGIPVGTKEDLGFALYTCEGFVGRPLMVPRRTKTDRAGVIGHVQAGDNHFD